MDNRTRDTFSWPQAFAWAFAIIAVLASSVLMATEAVVEENRVTVNSYFSQDGRDQVAPDKVSQDEHAPMSRATIRDKSALRSTQQKSTTVVSNPPNTDFWFFSVDVQTYNDADNDGYDTTVDVLFDADTYHTAEEVYAVLYLSYEGGPWEEYAATEDFWIYGSSASDDYVIISDLVSGYPTGSYDLLIELFDAWDNSFVADVGPESTSALALLSLEDEQRDSPPGTAPPPVVVTRGGGGAIDVLSLAFFVLASVAAGVVAVRRRRQPDSGLQEAVRIRARSS